MMPSERAARRMLGELSLEPAFLHRARFDVNVAIEPDHAPCSDLHCVVALARRSSLLAEVSVIGHGIRRVILVIAGNRQNPFFELPPQRSKAAR